MRGSLSEPGGTTAHDLALADQLSVEFRAIQRKVDIEVDSVEGSLRRIHALKVLFEVLS